MIGSKWNFFPILLASCILLDTQAFTIPSTTSCYTSTRQGVNMNIVRKYSSAMSSMKSDEEGRNVVMTNTLKSLVVAMALSINTMSPASASIMDDDSTETLNAAITSLKSASSNGDASATLKEFENIAAIITEGKGVGGSISNSKYGISSYILLLQHKQK